MAISMDSTQNKLLLLFVFDKMEMPLSEQTILEMCCSANNWINYIDCKQALMQLIDANFVAAVNNFYDRIRRFSHAHARDAANGACDALLAPRQGGKARQRRSRVGRKVTSQNTSHSAATPARDSRDR